MVLFSLLCYFLHSQQRMVYKHIREELNILDIKYTFCYEAECISPPFTFEYINTYNKVTVPVIIKQVT
jgi:hypothetical protein